MVLHWPHVDLDLEASTWLAGIVSIAVDADPYASAVNLDSDLSLAYVCCDLYVAHNVSSLQKSKVFVWTQSI
jgi:hypothetical protein